MWTPGRPFPDTNAQINRAGDIYDRRRRAETKVERIEDPRLAVARLFEVESLLQSEPGMGVVMLVAEDEETSRGTHSHYFKSLDELLDLAQA